MLKNFIQKAKEGFDEKFGSLLQKIDDKYADDETGYLRSAVKSFLESQLTDLALALRKATEVENAEGGIVLENGVNLADIPLELLTDIEQFRNGRKTALQEVDERWKGVME